MDNLNAAFIRKFSTCTLYITRAITEYILDRRILREPR